MCHIVHIMCLINIFNLSSYCYHIVIKIIKNKTSRGGKFFISILEGVFLKKFLFCAGPNHGGIPYCTRIWSLHFYCFDGAYYLNFPACTQCLFYVLLGLTCNKFGFHGFFTKQGCRANVEGKKKSFVLLGSFRNVIDWKYLAKSMDK